MHSFIAREAWPVLGVLIVSGVLGLAWENVQVLSWSALLFAVVALLARNPRCSVPSEPLGVVSPLHGRIAGAGANHDPWLARPAVHVRVVMRPWNVHVLRSPIEGTVQERWLARDRRPWIRRRHAVWIRTDEGDDVVMVLDLGVMAPFVRLRPRAGERTGQGQACGYCYLAASIDLYLPGGSRVVLPAGAAVAAGADVVAQFVHKHAAAVSPD